MNLKSKVIRGVVWSLVQGWGTQLGSLVIFFLLARLLTPETFGLVALANVFLAFIQVFLSQGFADALIQRETLEPEHLDAAFWTSLLLGVGLMILGITTSQQIAGFFDSPELAPILCWFSPLVLVDSLSSVHQAQLQRKFAFKSLAVRSLIGVLSGGLIGILMALYHWGVWALVAQQLTQELVSAIILWKAVEWAPRLQFSVKHWQDLSSFGLHQLGFNLVGFCNNRADDFLIGYYLDPVNLGYYSVAYRILTAMTDLLINTSSQVALPTFSRLKSDLERLQIAFYQATRFSSAIAFPIFTGIAILAPELIGLLFGEKWLPSVPVLQVLAVVGALRSVTYFKSSVFLAMNKPDWRLRLGLLSSTLNVVGFFIAVRWGIVAVALAYLTRACIVFPISQGTISKLIHIPMDRYLRQFLPSVVSVLIMGVVIYYFRIFISNFVDLLGILVLSTAIGGLVYTGSLHLFDPNFFKQLRELVSAKRERVEYRRN